MANIENLTVERVNRLSCEKGKRQSIFWESKTKGFGVRCTLAGAKTYIFETRLHGKTVRVKIGAVSGIDGVTLDAARKRAQSLRTQFNEGIDPREVKIEQIAKAEQKKTDAIKRKLLVQDAWNDYLSYQRIKMRRTELERGKRWGERHYADHVNLSQAGGEPKKRGKGLTVQGVLYPLLQMRLTDINSDTLIEWQRVEASERPNGARQGFEMFRAFWRWCAANKKYTGLIDSSAVEQKEVRDEVASRKSKKSDVLAKADLPAWFNAVRNLSNLVISAYLQALILTGARREEMAELKWEHINQRDNSIWIKDKVEEEGRVIPLTPYLASLLMSLPRRNEWVFSSPMAVDGRITEPRSAHARALKAAGIEHVTIHGLRRTFKNLAEWVEMPVGVVAQIMGHKPSATAEKHYTDRPLELLAIWHSKYEAWLLEQANIPFNQAQQTQGLRIVGSHK